MHFNTRPECSEDAIRSINNSMPDQEITLANQRDTQVAGFIEKAIAANMPVEMMEKLFNLHREVKADAAREAFVAAMAKFQAEVPVIEKKKKVMNKDGRSVRYMFAPLEEIVRQIKKPLADNGLSYAWTVQQEGAKVKAIATVTHIFGHSQESTFEIVVDSEGYMTAPQKTASAMTFAKRYALCNVLGISTADEDTDATDVKKDPTAISVKSRIVLALRTLGAKTDTADQCAEAVARFTQLKLEEKNYAEIVDRLEVLVIEKQEHENDQVQ